VNPAIRSPGDEGIVSAALCARERTRLLFQTEFTF
jgi:hypothetical protein